MELDYLVQSLVKGLALDLDETLSQTNILWIEEMSKVFGNPENLEPEEIIAKYRYTWKVPYWQKPEVNEWISKKVHDNDLQTRLPVIPDALKYVNEIQKIVPISAYITARPESVVPGTQEWLAKNGFPQAPVIARPNDYPRKLSNVWKAGVLEYLQQKVLGIVDDNGGILDHFKDYCGTIFLYDNEETPESDFDAVACPNWETVFEEVKKRYIQNS